MKDDLINSFLPKSLHPIAHTHFTSVKIINSALRLLKLRKEHNVLDIGSGIGTFCIVGSLNTSALFTGVEHRASLVKVSKKLIKQFNSTRVTIIQSDIRQVLFESYDRFYYYNPFQEYSAQAEQIDQSIDLDPKNQKECIQHVHHQLSLKKKGTRIVTYFSTNKEIPSSYKLITKLYDHKLKLWVKKS